MKLRERPLRWWAVATGLLIALTSWLFGSVVAVNLVACNADLEIVPQPSDWTDWPKLPDLGGYRIDGRPQMLKYQLGMMETELRDDGLCPRGGVSLDAWFVLGPEPSYTRTLQEVSLRGLGDTRVASAVRADGPPENRAETFLVAFRRQSGWRLRFESARAARFAAAFGACLLAVLAAAVASRRVLVAARAYEDAEIYEPGMLDALGNVVFEDGSPPIAAGGEGIAPSSGPGPVLVRVLGATAGTYRTAPSTTAVRIVVGDVESVVGRERSRARAHLVVGCAVALIVLAATAATAVSLAFEDFGRDMY